MELSSLGGVGSVVGAATAAACCAAAVSCCCGAETASGRPATRSRRPAWQPGRRAAPPTGWKLATGEAAHSITAAACKANTSESLLTGEAAGRQVWWHDASATDDDQHHTQLPPEWADSFEPSANPNSADRIFRTAQLTGDHSGVAPDPAPPCSAAEAARKGARFYALLQCADGHWAGDYGGPLFLLPGLVIVGHVTGSLDELLPGPARDAAVLYLRNHQQVDGGWGTHIESASTMFGTTLSYVMLRLLGVAAADPCAVAARTFMHAHGGALHAPSWAKFWLAVLGVYHWNGVNSMPVRSCPIVLSCLLSTAVDLHSPIQTR